MEEIMLAVEKLAANKTGALIVIERNIGLKTYVESGVALDAVLSYDLLVTIFNHDLPLHDGAVIVQNNRIAAAACFLPLTVKPRLSKDLGTRHRAAIGITEETDALAIIVSEETGSLAFAHDGRIERGLGLDELRSKVRAAFGAKRQAHAAISTVETPVQGPVQGTDERPSAS
jgi:diadenylate cyclase